MVIADRGRTRDIVADRGQSLNIHRGSRLIAGGLADFFPKGNTR